MTVSTAAAYVNLQATCRDPTSQRSCPSPPKCTTWQPMYITADTCLCLLGVDFVRTPRHRKQHPRILQTLCLQCTWRSSTCRECVMAPTLLTMTLVIGVAPPPTKVTGIVTVVPYPGDVLLIVPNTGLKEMSTLLSEACMRS